MTQGNVKASKKYHEKQQKINLPLLSFRLSLVCKYLFKINYKDTKIKPNNVFNVFILQTGTYPQAVQVFRNSFWCMFYNFWTHTLAGFWFNVNVNNYSINTDINLKAAYTLQSIHKTLLFAAWIFGGTFHLMGRFETLLNSFSYNVEKMVKRTLKILRCVLQKNFKVWTFFNIMHERI